MRKPGKPRKQIGSGLTAQVAPIPHSDGTTHVITELLELMKNCLFMVIGKALDFVDFGQSF
jgi:hypothetical protein